jgi:succinate-acetate transporter protein
MSGTHEVDPTSDPIATRLTSEPGSRSAEPTAAAFPSIADPAPLGLGAFAMTTFVLSVVNAGLIDRTAAPTVLGLALFYGGLVQLLAGMWEFRRGNVFGAVAFSSFGAFWLSYFFFVSFSAVGLTTVHEVGPASGLFLLAWAIFTGYMMIAALRVNVAVLAVFVLLFLTFVALVIGAFWDVSAVNKIGGWLGIATAAAAWYTSFAIVVNSTFKRIILPVGPLG